MRRGRADYSVYLSAGGRVDPWLVRFETSIRSSRFLAAADDNPPGRRRTPPSNFERPRLQSGPQRNGRRFSLVARPTEHDQFVTVPTVAFSPESDVYVRSMSTRRRFSTPPELRQPFSWSSVWSLSAFIKFVSVGRCVYMPITGTSATQQICRVFVHCTVFAAKINGSEFRKRRGVLNQKPTGLSRRCAPREAEEEDPNEDRNTFQNICHFLIILLTLARSLFR